MERSLPNLQGGSISLFIRFARDENSNHRYLELIVAIIIIAIGLSFDNISSSIDS